MTSLCRRWISPTEHEIVCILPGPDVTCLSVGQAVLVDGDRRRVTRISRRRNAIKTKPAAA